jgi:tripartite-type tricarboxylate transporter receptor subunit TctC
MHPILRYLRRVLPWLLAWPALAAAWPERPVRLIVPFGAGGITDIVARVTAEQLTTQLGQPVVIENRPGAGGNIAAAALAQAAPDGYTLMFTTVALLSVNPHLYDKLPFDPFRSFSYISTVASTPHAVVVHPAVGANSLQSLIQDARKRPEAIRFGTAGVGSSPHQGLEILQRAAGVRLLHVPYKSGAESVNAVLSGQIEMTFEALPVVMPHVRAGKLKALALAARERQGSEPGLMTTAEAGFAQLESGSVSGVLAPAGLPPEVQARLRAALKTVMNQPALKGRLFAQGSSILDLGPDEFAALVRTQYDRWGAILKPPGK